MDKVQRALHVAHLNFQRARSGNGRLPETTNESVRKGSHWQAPHLSALAIWNMMSDDYRRLFCEHGKAMFNECGSCHRDRKQAMANFAKIVGVKA